MQCNGFLVNTDIIDQISQTNEHFDQQSVYAFSNSDILYYQFKLSDCFDKGSFNTLAPSFTNGLFNSLCGKAASCLEGMLCGVLVWENQETHE